MKRLRALCQIAQTFEESGLTEAAQLIDSGVAMLSGKSVTPADFDLKEASDHVHSDLTTFLDSYATVETQQKGVALLASMAATSAITMIASLNDLITRIESEDLDVRDIATVIALTEAYEELNANS